jgi:hypothetical protein
MGVAIIFLLWPGMAFGVPVCGVSRVIPGPPLQVEFTVQDSKLGLKSINVVEQINASVQISPFPFPPGFINPVVVTATKGGGAQALKVTLQAEDMKGGVSTCQYEEEAQPPPPPPPEDTDAPLCFLSDESSGPPAWVKVGIQDTGSGLESIVAMEQTNATVSIPSFQEGTTTVVEVLVSQSVPNLAFSVVLQATDRSGNPSTCSYPTVSLTKTRPEFDAVGKDRTNAFSDFYKTLVVQHGLDSAGRVINDLSDFAQESFTTSAGALTPDPCFSVPGKTYLSALTPTWTEASYGWKITLQMKPASDLSLNLIGCILRAGESDPWTQARQTGLYRTPWPAEEPIFLPFANPKVTVRAFPGPFAVLGFPEAGFYLDARPQPGFNVSALKNSECTLQSLLEESVLLVAPITGHTNALGETVYELSQGDRLSITVELPYNSTADIRFGKDNAVVKYLGFVGTEYITGQ